MVQENTQRERSQKLTLAKLLLFKKKGINLAHKIRRSTNSKSLKEDVNPEPFLVYMSESHNKGNMISTWCEVNAPKLDSYRTHNN